jgi:hypothetical protein
MGGTALWLNPHRCRPIHHGLPARVVVVVFEPCMLTMVTEGGMGLRELAMPVDKVGAADSLTRAVTIMVIIIVERIKRSRREEVDGGQLERAVEKGRLC